MVKQASYGCWQSPISTKTTCASSPRFFELYSDDKTLLYTKTDPSSSRVGPILCDQRGQSILADPYSPKSRVHEFGGGAFAVLSTLVVFSNKSDDGVYFMKEGGCPTLIFQNERFRFADFCIHPSGQWAICVVEEHTDTGIINTLCSLPIKSGGEPTTLHSGYDFYSSPTFSECGNKCAFISWDHPYMPWDRTQLWLGRVNDHTLFSEINTITDGSSSATHPKFSPDGTLFFFMDSSGFSQLYTYKEEQVHQLTDIEGDLATPDWVFNLSRFDFLSDKKAASILTYQGIDHLVVIDLISGGCSNLEELPFNDYSHLAVCEGLVYTFAAAKDKARALVTIDPVSSEYELIDGNDDLPFDSAFISQPISLTIDRKASPLFAFFYPPTNPEFCALEGEKMPLIIKAHSGPTSHSKPSLQMPIQFWTSRGFAFMEVNYRGSSGYGKDYRDQLYGNWSRFDSEDCVDAADFVINKYGVDPDRIFIKGSSAGGLTVLSCLTKTTLFKGAICYYGISDMAAICSHEDHKFESHYTRRLLSWGSMDELEKQSAIHNVSSIKTPTLFFQGGKDYVVPESQTRTMYQALVKEGKQTAFGYFPNEGHGFRSHQTLTTCLEAELFFISYLLNLKADNNKKSTDVQWNV